MSEYIRANTITETAVEQLKEYARYIHDNAENIIGNIDKPNYVTEEGIHVSFTLAYNEIPTLKVEKEYIVVDALRKEEQ